MTTDNFCFYLWNRLIQTSQTGGQWYSDTSPLVFPATTIPCSSKGILAAAINKTKQGRRYVPIVSLFLIRCLCFFHSAFLELSFFCLIITSFYSGFQLISKDWMLLQIFLAFLHFIYMSFCWTGHFI